MNAALIPPFQLSLRSALSAGLAVALAHLCRFQSPLYALIGAVIVNDLSPVKTREFGIQRLAGSVVGGAIGAAASVFLPPNAGTIGLSVFVAMFLSHVLRLQGAMKLAGYLAGLVVLEHSSEGWRYGFLRVLETFLGIGVALLVSFVPKLISIDPSKQQDPNAS